MAIFRRSDPTQQAGTALAELYREHATATFRFALHMCGSRDDAEDLVQIAFLEAYRRLVGAARPVELSDELARVRAVLVALPAPQHEAFVLRHWCDLANSEIAEVLGTSESAVESLLVRARRAVAGAEELPADCVAFRERLARGLPETIALQEHRAGCRGCRTAAERLSQAAAVAAVVALAPRPSVAHALAASVHGFTVTAATSTGTGVAGAAAAKTVAAKVLLATVAVTGTVAAVRTGVVPVPAILHSHHRPLVGTARSHPSAIITSRPAGADRTAPVPNPVDHDRPARDSGSRRHGGDTSAGDGQDGSRSQQDGGSQDGSAGDQGSPTDGSTGSDGSSSGDSGQQDQTSSGDSSGSGSNDQGGGSANESSSSGDGTQN
jgi:DNA-directed RNA polymerase specialized sigma24 family protein